MISFLAETATNPAGFEPGALVLGVWMICAFFALNLIGTGVMIVKTMRNDAERREVTINPEALTRREFEQARIVRDEEVKNMMDALKDHVKQHYAEVEGIHRKIGGVERGARAELAEALRQEKSSRGELHKQMNEVLIAVGEIRGKLTQL